MPSEIWTNKAGNVDFYLTRADGPKQAASVKTEKVSDGYMKRWLKTYTHDQSVDLSYQVVLANQPMASDCAHMALNCGAKADIKNPAKLANCSIDPCYKLRAAQKLHFFLETWPITE